MSGKLKQLRSHIYFVLTISALLFVGFSQPFLAQSLNKSINDHVASRIDISSYGRKPTALPSNLADQKKSGFPVLEKMHSLVQVRINDQIEIPENGDQEVVLEAWVKANGDLKGSPVKFEWQLDPGVHVIEGEISGEISDLREGEYKYFPLRVYGFSREAQKLAVIKASVDLDGDRLGQSNQYNSRPEDSFEYIAPALQEEADKLNIVNARSRGKLQR